MRLRNQRIIELVALIFMRLRNQRIIELVALFWEFEWNDYYFLLMLGKESPEFFNIILFVLYMFVKIDCEVIFYLNLINRFKLKIYWYVDFRRLNDTIFVKLGRRKKKGGRLFENNQKFIGEKDDKILEEFSSSARNRERGKHRFIGVVD